MHIHVLIMQMHADYCYCDKNNNAITVCFTFHLKLSQGNYVNGSYKKKQTNEKNGFMRDPDLTTVNFLLSVLHFIR